MSPHTLPEPITLKVGTASRAHLLEALLGEGVQLNASAETLLDNPVFDVPAPESVTVVERSLSELGLDAGAALPRIFDVADEQGLTLCPPITGPYLRLAWLSQLNAPDAILSNGRAPSGSLTVAALLFSADDSYPKGFYLRVINGEPWLRGYRCGVVHAWNPDDRFFFATSHS